MKRRTRNGSTLFDLFIATMDGIIERPDKKENARKIEQAFRAAPKQKQPGEMGFFTALFTACIVYPAIITALCYLVWGTNGIAGFGFKI